MFATVERHQFKVTAAIMLNIAQSLCEGLKP